MLRSVHLSVCLSHAPSSEVVHFRATVTIHVVLKKRPPFYYFKYLCQKLSDFNDFWCVKSRENLTPTSHRYVHLTCQM